MARCSSALRSSSPRASASRIRMPSSGTSSKAASRNMYVCRYSSCPCSIIRRASLSESDLRLRDAGSICVKRCGATASTTDRLSCSNGCCHHSGNPCLTARPASSVRSADPSERTLWRRATRSSAAFRMSAGHESSAAPTICVETSSGAVLSSGTFFVYLNVTVLSPVYLW